MGMTNFWCGFYSKPKKAEWAKGQRIVAEFPSFARSQKNVFPAGFPVMPSRKKQAGLDRPSQPPQKRGS